MSDYLKSKIWLIGAGYMAQEYAKVLKAQNLDFDVIGKSEISATIFTEKTGINVIAGGITNHIQRKAHLPEFAIVAVNVENLAEVTNSLLAYGIKHILVEKPAGLTYDEIYQVAKKAREEQANVYVAYNRRFYASVKKAQEIIRDDGGATSFNFEFTEWSHVIEKINTPDIVKQQWLLANSSHVIDLAFYLGGKPKEISCYKAGALSWHKVGSNFVGSGRTESGALFSYQANWEAPGRWGVEVMTQKHRLILRPLEQLQVQKIGSTEIAYMEIEDQLDHEFKPGLYEEVKAFMYNQDKLIDIFEYAEDLCCMKKICCNG